MSALSPNQIELKADAYVCFRRLMALANDSDGISLSRDSSLHMLVTMFSLLRAHSTDDVWRQVIQGLAVFMHADLAECEHRAPIGYLDKLIEEERARQRREPPE